MTAARAALGGRANHGVVRGDTRLELLRDGGLEQASVAAFEATLEDGSVDKRGRQRAMKKMLQPLIDRQRRSAARG